MTSTKVKFCTWASNIVTHFDAHVLGSNAAHETSDVIKPKGGTDQHTPTHVRALAGNHAQQVLRAMLVLSKLMALKMACFRAVLI